MAWPYDQEGFQSPQLSAMSLGNMGSSVPFTTDTASGAQNIASLFSGTQGGSVPTGSGGNSMFSSIGDLFSKNSLFGGTDARGVTTKGWAPMALGIGQALFGAYQGQQAQKMAQQQFKEGKRQFDLNYGAQRQSMNTAMEDRQRARVASNPGAYESVSAYMDKNRIN